MQVPRIVSAFLTSRLESVATVEAGGAEEDPLESEEGVQEQLEALPPLLRFQYQARAAGPPKGPPCSGARFAPPRSAGGCARWGRVRYRGLGVRGSEGAWSWKL